MKLIELALRNVGPIKEANLRFGDLTVLVGPQATGKSICLQFLKLMLDDGVVRHEMERYGLNWKKEVSTFLSIFLGEGMGSVWTNKSELYFRGRLINLAKLVRKRKGTAADEKMFLIPAQRVLTVARGWPRPFTDYAPGDPYCVRDFSEKIRRLMEESFSDHPTLFPQPQRFNKEIRDVIAPAVFAKFELSVGSIGPQKRLELHSSGNGDHPANLPFMVWSAGQREFVPLLLGAYWLCPAGKTSRRDSYEWVVIEEIEMGLHPKAVVAAMVVVLEFLRRGYRVCLSTHSSHVLDVMWALGVFQAEKADASCVLDLFDLRKTPSTTEIADRVLDANLRVYSFDRETASARDISHLDPGSTERQESGWGGLTEFSGRVADLVAEVVNG